MQTENSERKNNSIENNSYNQLILKIWENAALTVFKKRRHITAATNKIDFIYK